MFANHGPEDSLLPQLYHLAVLDYSIHHVAILPQMEVRLFHSHFVRMLAMSFL
jgi:hypothetical protein